MTVIIVTGLPRSGTSMMMRMLQAGGVTCAFRHRADKFNPGGYYETLPGLQADLRFMQGIDGQAVKCLHALTRLPADFDAKVIVMRRDLKVTLASCNRICVANGDLPLPPEGLENLQGTLDSIRLWCARRPHVEVWYDDMLRNTANECQRIDFMLGGTPQRPVLDLAAMARIPKAGYAVADV